MREQNDKPTIPITLTIVGGWNSSKIYIVGRWNSNTISIYQPQFCLYFVYLKPYASTALTLASTPLPPLVLRAQSLSVDNLEEDYVFPEPEDVTGLALTNGSSASILLPQELLFSRGMGKSILHFPGSFHPQKVVVSYLAAPPTGERSYLRKIWSTKKTQTEARKFVLSEQITYRGRWYIDRHII